MFRIIELATDTVNAFASTVKSNRKEVREALAQTYIYILFRKQKQFVSFFPAQHVCLQLGDEQFMAQRKMISSWRSTESRATTTPWSEYVMGGWGLNFSWKCGYYAYYLVYKIQIDSTAVALSSRYWVLSKMLQSKCKKQRFGCHVPDPLDVLMLIIVCFITFIFIHYCIFIDIHCHLVRFEVSSSIEMNVVHIFVHVIINRYVGSASSTTSSIQLLYVNQPTLGRLKNAKSRWSWSWRSRGQEQNRV